jgi:hypothetical protein
MASVKRTADRIRAAGLAGRGSSGSDEDLDIMVSAAGNRRFPLFPLANSG